MRFCFLHALIVVGGLASLSCAQIMGMEEADVVDSLPGEGGSGGGGEGGSGQGGTSQGGSGGGDCTPGTTDPCSVCMAEKCCGAVQSCASSSNCQGILDCMVGCLSIDTMDNCRSYCDTDSDTTFLVLQACMLGQCTMACGGT